MTDSIDVDRLRGALAGRYRVERRLGAGGMGEVYLARDLKHGRKVAIKVLRPELTVALGAERFLREIGIVAHLNHPHIVPLHDSGQADEYLYYVMPAIDGESLRDKLDREGRIDIGEALKVANDVAKALDHAHRQGVVHRDVKPANILLHEGEALVSDFGIALAVSKAGDARLTQTGASLGTPQYMSPEQIDGTPDADARADVYALGCVLYEMLAGEPPYPGSTAQAVIAKQLADPAPSVRRLRAQVPKAIDRAIIRAMAKTPADRFDSTGGFATALVEGPKSQASHAARVGIGAIAVVALATTWLAVGGPGSNSRAPPATPRLAVLPWGVPGGADDLSYLSEGLVHLLSASLDGVGDMRMVDPHALLSFVDRECAVVDPDCGQRVAARFGAGRYVLGSVVPLGSDRFQLIASPYERDGTALESVRATAALERPEEAIDAIGRGLVVAEVDEAELSGVAALTSMSLPALKAYLEGERAFRILDIPVALNAFGRALAIDTTFALAHYRLAEAAEWAGQHDLSRVHAPEALRYGDRLPERAGRLLEAFELWLSGDATAAEAAYRSILRTYPDDVTAWYWLAETLLHWNPLRGRPSAEAEEAFGRVLTYEPSHIGLGHLVEIRERRGELSQIDSLADRFLELGALPAFDFFVDAPRVVALRDSARVAELLNRAQTESDDALVAGALNAPVYTGNLGDSRNLLSELLAEERDPFVRALGHLALAHLDVAEGRWSDAQPHLDAADELRAGWGLEHRAYLATLPWLELPRPALTEVQAELAAWDGAWLRWEGGGNAFFLPVFLKPHVGSHEPIRTYLRGLLSARLQDTAAVRAFASRLEQAELPERAGSFAPDAAGTLRALAWQLEGRETAALEELESAEMRVTYPLMISSAFHSRARHRYLYAELLTRLGDDERALGWYASIAEESPYDLVYLAPAALRQAEIHERTGDRNDAIRHYERFVQLWSDADPTLQPLVEAAEARIAELLQ